MMMLEETGIPCFECGERSGIDCPGRRPDEATRCEVCLKKFMEEERVRHEEHMKIARRIMDENRDLLKRLADS